MIFVSIPEGAIEGDKEPDKVKVKRAFQYPKVRLKEMACWRSYPPPLVSIPEGAIEGPTAPTP